MNLRAKRLQLLTWPFPTQAERRGAYGQFIQVRYYCICGAAFKERYLR